MRKVKLIYNPTAGEKAMEGSLDAVVRIYQRHGLQIVPHRLEFDDSCEQGLVFDLDGGGYDHILVAGGDGTVNYAVDALRRRGFAHIPLGLLPVGTANDFAHNLGMPANISAACRKILTGRTIDADLGVVNDRCFVNVLGAGLFSDLSLRTPTVMKNNFGKLAYYFGGLGELTKLHKLRIRLSSDGGDFDGDCHLVLALNGKTAGSLRLAHDADICDGLLDVLVLRVGTLETMQTITHYFRSSFLRRPVGDYPPGIVHLRCSRLRIESQSDEPVDIDGQRGPGFPLDIRCEHAALRLIVPASNKHS